MSEYKPPFHMTDKIINLISEISEQVGRVTVLSHGDLNPASVDDLLKAHRSLI